MRFPTLFVTLLLLCGSAFGGGTVGFNVKWYSTPQFPFVDDNYPVTTGVVIADFNRDGIPDVAYSWPCCENSGSPGAVIVKMGTGGGSLGPDMTYGFGANDLGPLVAADVNGDGWLDIVARDPLQGWLTVLLNNGDGTFQAFATVHLGGGPFVVGDFNRDGKLDIADIACDSPNGNYPSGTSSCMLSVGLGDNSGANFAQSESIQLTSPAYDLKSADLNGDGKLDLIFVRGSVGVMLWGRGDGTFSGPTYLKPGTTDPMDSVAVADFNNDGRLDVALLSGNPCRPDPDTGACGPNVNTVWMYKNNGGTNFTLTTHAPFNAQAGAIMPADLNGDLNQDLVYYNPFATGIDPIVGAGGGPNDYALGLGNDTLGARGTLPAGIGAISAVAARDMNGDSRADYAFIDWNKGLAIGIQTGGWKNCPSPSSANLAAKVCGTSNGATVSSPLLLRASGNSPAGVNQLQVWIDGKKQYVKWGDQLAKKFALSSGKHRIAVVANDVYSGSATTAVNVTVP